jgi:hypothetical protein
MFKDKLQLYVTNSSLAKPTSQAINKAIAQHFDMVESTENNLSVFPKQEDFLLFPFRQLSATIVGSGTYKSTDFSDIAVLKKSMKLLENISAYTNHNDYVGREIGTIGKPKWSDSYVTDNGVLVPAGIDAPFVIDTKLYPTLCRQLNSPVSPIKCCSVSIEFMYKPSHEFKNEYDFRNSLGETIDGVEVRRIVTEIIGYAESSLVSRGADKFAKKLDETGKLINIPYSAEDREKDVQQYESAKFFAVDTEYEVAKMKFDLPTETPKAEEKMKILLIDDKGTKQEVEWAKFDDKFVAIEVANFDTIKAELETAKSQLSAKYTEIVELKKSLQPLEELMTAKRQRAKALYETFTEGKPNPLMISDIEKADSQKLDAYIETFGGKVAENLGCGVCKDCKSQNVEFRSTNTETDNQKVTPECNTSLKDKIL